MNYVEFMACEDWPSKSPDLNLLDSQQRNILEKLVQESKPYPIINSLETDLVKPTLLISLYRTSNTDEINIKSS